mgnify:CR=1 FL=1
MNYLRFLKFSIITLITVGLSILIFPFIAALSPNANSLENAVNIDVSTMLTGESRTEKLGLSTIFVTRLSDDEFNVFHLPYKKGEFLLPEFDWQRPVLPCVFFIQEDGFQCLDTKNESRLWYSYMTWNKNGKYIGEHKWGHKVPDLMSLDYIIQGNQLIILGV